MKHTPATTAILRGVAEPVNPEQLVVLHNIREVKPTRLDSLYLTPATLAFLLRRHPADPYLKSANPHNHE
jgi:hypothetical protein